MWLTLFLSLDRVRAWLYRIATNTCLDALSDRARRERPFEAGPQGTMDDTLEEKPRTHWLEPIADAKAIPADGDPAEHAILRQSIRLAFVAALQHLPPRQRAALILTEVLGWSAAAVATTLDTSAASVNSALQRARATLATRPLGDAPAALSDAHAVLVDRYVAASSPASSERANPTSKEAAPRSKAALWTGRVLSGLAVLFMLMDASMKLLQLPVAVEGTTSLGYPASVIFTLGVIQLVCLIAYLVPRTAVLGAILWVGYLGGAVAAHVRLGNPLFSHILFPLYVAAFLWVGLALRDDRVKALFQPR